MDWWGNLTFAVGLIAVLVGITYGIQPYGGHVMGWTSPFVLTCLLGGVAGARARSSSSSSGCRTRCSTLALFRIRAFTLGNMANLLASLGRGGLQFMLIIWLQGIWLPQHGYGFAETPLWAGIYMLPLTVGFLVVGAAVRACCRTGSGARWFATGGMVHHRAELPAAGAAADRLPATRPSRALLLLNGARAWACSPRRTGPR